MRIKELFKLIKTKLQKQILMYEKSEKNNVLILELGKKMETYFILKNACLRHRRKNFFFGYSQKMRNSEYFKLLKIGIENKINEVQNQ